MEKRNIAEENISETNMDINIDNNLKTRSKKHKDDFHEKECKVIHYNKVKKTLDIYYDTYGIRIKNVENFSGASVIVKCKGEIGKPNFKVSL